MPTRLGRVDTSEYRSPRTGGFFLNIQNPCSLKMGMVGLSLSIKRRMLKKALKLSRKRALVPGLAAMAVLLSVSGYMYVSAIKASTALPADINNDRIVNVFDLSLLLGAWGKTGVS